LLRSVVWWLDTIVVQDPARFTPEDRGNRSSRKFLSNCHTAWRRNPENRELYLHCRDKHRCRIGYSRFI